MLYCQQCGAGNGGDARFCNQCGSKIAGAGEPGGPIAAVEEKPEPKEESAPSPIATMPGHGESVKVAKAEEAPEEEEQAPPPRKKRVSEERVSAPYPPQQNVDISTVSLSDIGVRSRGKAWIVMVAVVVVLLGLGAGGMWLAMNMQDEGEAHADSAEPAVPDAVPPDDVPDEGGEIEIGDPLPEGTDPDDVIAGRPRPRNTGEPREAAPPGERPPTARQPTKQAQRQPSAPSEGGNVPEPWTNQPTQERPASTEPAGRDGTPNTIPPDEGGEPNWEALEEEDTEMDAYSSHVRNVIRSYYMRRAQTCFDMATRNNASVRGTVVIGFDIQADGHIRNSSVERNSTGIDTVGRCLASQVGAWQLPRPPAGSAPLAMQMPFSR